MVTLNHLCTSQLIKSSRLIDMSNLEAGPGVISRGTAIGIQVADAIIERLGRAREQKAERGRHPRSALIRRHPRAREMHVIPARGWFGLLAAVEVKNSAGMQVELLLKIRSLHGTFIHPMGHGQRCPQLPRRNAEWPALAPLFRRRS
jgi:hypothetical protein